MVGYAQRRQGRQWAARATVLMLGGALAGCMTSPKHGQVLPRMGTQIGLVAFAGPGATFTFEYALHRNTGSGYVIDELRPLGTCAASTPVFTDVQGVLWQGCAITTTLPVSDCAKGGRGAWRGDPSNFNNPQRFSRVRTTVNGGELFVYPSTVTDAQLEASYNSVGGLSTIATYQAGTQAELRVDAPSVGVSGFPEARAATDVVVVGDRAYVGRGAGAGAELGIFDVATAGVPQLLKAVDIGAGVRKVFVEGDYAYLATDDPLGQLVIVAVADPASAAVVQRIPLAGPEPATAVTAVGGIVLIGRAERTGQPEFEVWTPVDAAHPTDLTLADTLEAGGDVNGIDVSTGLFVPPATQVEKTVAYLATNRGVGELRAVDLTDPANLVSHGNTNLPGNLTLRDVEYHRGAVYAVADDNAGSDVFVLQVGGATGNTLTLTGSRAINTNNTGVAFYADTLLVSSSNAASALTVLDPSTPIPASLNIVPSTTGAAGLAVRHGVAHLATSDAAQLQLVSPGLQLEPTLPWQNTVLGCLGDSNTAQGDPGCSLANPYYPKVPTCPGGETPTCELVSPTSIDTTVVCPAGGTPSCLAHLGSPVCSLSWCGRVGKCLAADPSTPPSFCSVEGRNWTPRPAWSIVNTGAGFAPILTTASHMADGPEQMAQSLIAGSNAFVIALGSVDILVGNTCTPYATTFSQILGGLDALRAQAGSAQVFYTIPPPFSEFGVPLACMSGCDGINAVHCFNREMLRYRNRLLHELPPERIIDLHSGVVRPGPSSDFNLPDVAHFNPSGQNRRARTALGKLAD